MKCLVTGGAGFIGSHLCERLAEQGDEVRVLDNFSSGKLANIEGLPLQVIEGDIRDSACLERAVAGVETVFHQAALCSVARSMADPQSTHEVNATGTLKLLEACRREGVKRVVVASSSAIYGDLECLPKHEGMAAAPLSPYAISKLVCEQFCQIYWSHFGLETVALRYFNVFGPRQDPGSECAAVIPKFLDAILSGAQPRVYGDGTQTRDFTYVENVVQANLAAAASPWAAGQVMNIACGDRWSLLELLNWLEDILDCEVSPLFLQERPGDVKHSQACIKQAEELIGYLPAVGFGEGMHRTVEWFLAHRGLAEKGFMAKKGVMKRGFLERVDSPRQGRLPLAAGG